MELCSVTEPLTVVNSDWTASTRREKYLQEITRVRYVAVSYIEIPPSPPSQLQYYMDVEATIRLQ
jgi:hypothetical protein